MECLEILEYLVSHGASITSTTNCSEYEGRLYGYGTCIITHNKNITPLHLAKGACAEFLIKKGANVFAVDDQGRTPLFWAVALYKYEPDLAAVAANLAKGSPPNLEDRFGYTPLLGLAASVLRLQWVSMKSLHIFLAVANALLDAGAVPPSIDRKGSPSLS